MLQENLHPSLVCWLQNSGESVFIPADEHEMLYPNVLHQFRAVGGNDDLFFLRSFFQQVDKVSDRVGMDIPLRLLNQDEWLLLKKQRHKQGNDIDRSIREQKSGQITL